MLEASCTYQALLGKNSNAGRFNLEVVFAFVLAATINLSACSVGVACFSPLCRSIDGSAVISTPAKARRRPEGLRSSPRLRSLGDDVPKSVRVDRFGGDDDVDGFAQPRYLASLASGWPKHCWRTSLPEIPDRWLTDIRLAPEQRIDIDLHALGGAGGIERAVQEGQEFLHLLLPVEDRREPLSRRDRGVRASPAPRIGSDSSAVPWSRLGFAGNTGLG